jgi:hypothetical protein
MTEDDTATVSDGGDLYEALPGGQIRFHAGGRVITLRPPKFGEYRELKDALNAGIADAKENKDGDSDDVVANFVTRAMEILGDGVIDVDDRPIWMTNGGLPAEMTKHWRNVPLAPGS